MTRTPTATPLRTAIVDAARALDSRASASGNERARRHLLPLLAPPATLAEAAEAFETLAHVARALGDDGAAAGTLL